MAEISDEFHLRSRREGDERKRIDFDDLQNELAGRETGRIDRFLDKRDSKKRAEARGKELSRLRQLLLSNAAYAALYNDTFDKLREAEQALEEALALAIEVRSKVQQALDDTLESAARLPDSTRVFRDSNGDLWTERGEKVADEMAASIHWRGDEPVHERFEAQSQALERIDGGIKTIRSGQVEVLGKIRDELTDEENPTSEERMTEMGTELENYRREVHLTMTDLEQQNRMTAEAPMPSAAAATSTLLIPDM